MVEDQDSRSKAFLKQRDILQHRPHLLDGILIPAAALSQGVEDDNRRPYVCKLRDKHLHLRSITDVDRVEHEECVRQIRESAARPPGLDALLDPTTAFPRHIDHGTLPGGQIEEPLPSGDGEHHVERVEALACTGRGQKPGRMLPP